MPTRDEIRQVVLESVSSTFGVAIDDLEETMDSSDVVGWDSISTSHLILEVEERLNRELDLARILEARNLGEMIDLISRD